MNSFRAQLNGEGGGYSQAKLNAVARQLNERPIKTLGFQTPAGMFSQTVASTG
jgi:IS30 family transposase